MQQDLSRTSSPACEDGVPLPIVTLNRSVLLAGVAIGLIAQQPLLTTLLFLLLLPAVIFGQRGSPIAAVGRRLFARQILTAEREDRRLMRFNNTIALVLLGAAQIAFLAGLPTLGWAFALMVGIAAGVALAGFCFGCFLYYQFKLHRYRIFG
ncbi:MAG TPA: DUF4395 domain-containing protein [Herpetosiphonaceae bacterium]